MCMTAHGPHLEEAWSIMFRVKTFLALQTIGSLLQLLNSGVVSEKQPHTVYKQRSMAVLQYYFLYKDTGCLGLVHWDDPEGWYGVGGGRRVQDGEHMYTCGGFILIFGKTNTIM